MPVTHFYNCGIPLFCRPCVGSHVYDLAAEVVRDRIENTEMAALYPWQEERMENTGWCWRDATTIDVHVSGNGK
jgi:hypothetical protein